MLGVATYDDPFGGLPPKEILFCAADTFINVFGGFPFWFLRRHIFMDGLEKGLLPPALLLCMLSLVARFIQPCYQPYGGTTEASAHFGYLAREQLSRMHDDITLLNLHCNLFMTLYEFGHGDEHRAWLRVGVAKRLCQALGLLFDNGGDDPNGLSAEVNRRTYWTCFALERLLVNGRDRPLTDVSTCKTRTQLPGSMADFITGRIGHCHIFTSLSVSPSSTDTLEAFTIRIFDLFSRVVEWGGAGVGGRHEDPTPPWNEDMPFSQLQRELQQWQNCLPPYLIFSEANIRAHIEANEGRLFGMMHLFYLTAGIRLHRKYIPFTPPIFYDFSTDGPSDGPELPPCSVPPGYWADIARRSVQFASGITKTLTKLGEHGIHPWTIPLSGVSILESCSIHIFVFHGYWSSCEEFVGEPTKNMLVHNLRLLIKMQESWPVAAFWVSHFASSYSFCQNVPFINTICRLDP